jgi:hypothetical protein
VSATKDAPLCCVRELKGFQPATHDTLYEGILEGSVECTSSKRRNLHRIFRSDYLRWVQDEKRMRADPNETTYRRGQRRRGLSAMLSMTY